MDIRMQAILKILYEELFHENHIFPEGSNETVTLTAGGTINTYGAWAEIADNNSVTLDWELNF